MKLIRLLSFLFISLHLLAQPHGKGAIFDESEFQTVLKAPPLTRGDFAKLPSRFSLKIYTPVPGDQGTTSTCTGWAVSYSARTILAAINNKWNKAKITRNAFSPSFIYNQIRNVNSCNSGASLVDALLVLQNDGTLPMREFGYDCNKKVTKKDKRKASKYRIREFRQIADRYNKNKVLNIKKSISQKKPVIIGINCPDSFYDVKNVWNPVDSDYVKNFGGHALTVIGYDDEKYGGAVEVLNSWGVNWGASGYGWIRYKDIQHFCVWAAEILGKENIDTYKASAKIFLKLVAGPKIKLKQNGTEFITTSNLKTGDIFQLFIENTSPVYLNVLSWDTTKVVKRLFPNNLRESSYLAYSENYLIFPQEDYAFEIDSVKGTTRFLLLFSSEKLNIDREIISSITTGERIQDKIFNRIKNSKPDKMELSVINDEKIVLTGESKNNFIQPVLINLVNSN